ncbi:hypothetical protein IscW_ISCW015436 [Ixodes scapularis]|uniref:Nose resistant-to-fluoxetine protein N-terminal domain-containing protein n=1 Tax=Ixodes scapularis TaxID=6945 RepID=B7QND2_IXOSC|nr:hypothetical protein IscW_ISCW015436 [Ixodes scapularis]|eukprot:XP_002416437.1 hypothetical protein IscW_ISCW015436 [Ixodes scapularis]
MCVSSQCTARSLPRLEKNVFYPALSGMTVPVFSANPALAAALNETLELDTSLAYMYFLKFRIGMCVPSTCSLQDMRSLAGYCTSRFVS